MSRARIITKEEFATAKANANAVIEVPYTVTKNFRQTDFRPEHAYAVQTSAMAIQEAVGKVIWGSPRPIEM